MIDLSADERARPFAFEGGDVGCLLLHGFTGTPCEMRPIGERLAAAGYTVRAPLLPGHGTRVEDLASTVWEDWYGAALESWHELGTRTRTRAAAGLSMGALLALHLAFDRPREVRAVAALAPAIELASQKSAEMSRWVRWLPPLPRRVGIVPKRGSNILGVGRATPAYDEIPLRALGSMLALQTRVRSELPRITVPVLVLEGGLDDTISPRAAADVEAALGSAIKSRVRFPRSGHVMTEDVDSELVVDRIERFFAEHATSA